MTVKNTNIFLELGNLRHQVQGLEQKSDNSTFLLDWKEYKKRNKKARLFPVREKRNTKSLPTKSVLVKSKNPFIRKQHYNPNKEGKKQRDPSIDKLINTMRKGGSVDHEKLNKVINKYESDNSEQMQDLFTAISDIAITKEFSQPGSAIRTIFKGLDIDRKIAGTSVGGYLTHNLQKVMSGDASGNLLNYAASAVTKVDKNSSNTDKDMAVQRLRNRSQFVDIKDREKFVDNTLSEFVDQEYTEHAISTILFDKLAGSNPKATEIGDTLNYARNKVHTNFLSSILDHTISKYGSNNVSKVFNKVSKKYSSVIQKSVSLYMTGQGANDDSQSASWQLLGASNNPKAMHEFMRKSKISPQSMEISDKPRLTKMMNGWIRGSGHGIGSLMRKSALSSVGMSLVGDPGHLPNKYSLYPGKELTKDKIPDNVIRSMQQMHAISKEFLHEKDVDSDLYRGVSFSDIGDESISFKSMLSSSSANELIAESFAGSAEIKGKKNRRRYAANELDRLKSDEQLILSKSMTPYIKSIDTFSSPITKIKKEKGFLLTYDKQKLMADNKIFAIFSSANFQFMKEKYGIEEPKMIKEYGDEQEYLLAI